MKKFAARSTQKELIDAADLPLEDWKKNLNEISKVNTYLGGYSAYFSGLFKLSKNQPNLTILELGCGQGDALAELQKQARKRKLNWTFIGLDLNPQAIKWAKDAHPDIQFIQGDALTVALDKVDIVCGQLFTHHLSSEEIVTLVDKWKNKARLGIVFNDLHRHFVAYYFISFIGQILSLTYLFKNDAPLSVLRGFSREDWKSIVGKIKGVKATIKWKWAFRWNVLIWTHEAL